MTNTKRNSSLAHINDHVIAVPSDMKAIDGGMGPGAYDYILYRGCEICTFDTEDNGSIYRGPFCVGDDEGAILNDEAPTLDVARIIIDAYLAKK